MAQERLRELHERGIEDATVYNPTDTSVGGIHAFFLIRGDPRAYNLPPKPEVPTIYLKDGWRSAGWAAGMLALGSLFAFLSTPARNSKNS